MQDIVHAAAGSTKSIEIEQIGFVKVDAIQYLGYVFTLASGKVVEPSHLFALCQQQPGQWTR